MIETPDPVQREWLMKRLRDLRNLHCEYVWTFKVAEEVLARQETSGEYVDVGELLRNCVLGNGVEGFGI